MKRLAIILLALLALSPVRGGECQPHAEKCLACKDCSRCRYCSGAENSATCSVCREEKRAAEKQTEATPTPAAE